MNLRPPVFGAPGGPLAQFFALLVFGALLVVAVVMGAVILAAILGLAVIAWTVFSVRLWWLKRKLGGRAAHERGPQPPNQPGGQLIDAEYTVLGERDARRRPDHGRDGDGRDDARH
jgi:membrane protein implicated in regulation of membrane protease activity